MTERIAVIDGVRTPMARAGTAFKDTSADDLGAVVVREALARSGVAAAEIDEVIIGNVAQPPQAANIARVIALKAGIPARVPAVTVQRNCASGMEAITTAALKISAGYGRVFIAGGVESMSGIPLLFPKEYADFLNRLSRAKKTREKLAVLLQFRLRMLRPEIALMQGLTDPVSGLIMGLTAENLAREFAIRREDQDAYALLSNQRALEAVREGTLDGEVQPVPVPPRYDAVLTAETARGRTRASRRSPG